jgi:hypothetical protein
LAGSPEKIGPIVGGDDPGAERRISRGTDGMVGAGQADVKRRRMTGISLWPSLFLTSRTAYVIQSVF